MNYKARQKPEVFKPMIDEALLRIARVANVDEDAVSARLGEVEPGGDSWHYLYEQALPAVSEILYTDQLDELFEDAGNGWGQMLFSQDLDGELFATRCVATAAEDDDPDEYPVVLEYYPQIAHECLKQENYVGGQDDAIVALWKREDRTSICVAWATEEEEMDILGEDTIDWIESIAGELEDA
jgi:hypothetical protein